MSCTMVTRQKLVCLQGQWWLRSAAKATDWRAISTDQSLASSYLFLLSSFPLEGAVEVTEWFQAIESPSSEDW